MARITVEGSTLVVEMEGLDKLWALKSRLDIPLANVRGATADPGIVKEPKGVRAPGSHFPGLLVAGSFHTRGEWVFWDVKDGARAVGGGFVGGWRRRQRRWVWCSGARGRRKRPVGR
ncbi:hypothetical protein, partial [Streptomyces sp. NPDC059597]|uniref:hypothetical protein n=1 Tax=Streptomyces sp. NPDC059597 TaxID=3346879 RepID=UPI0036A906F5